jgi:heme exporter protein D
VFFVVLLWDFIAPRIDIARQLRAARLRASRKAPRPDIDTLSRTETQ